MLHIAKDALDKIIRKGRIHFYKPIQIAEILYHDRLQNPQINIDDLQSYRNISKRWRDNVSIKLVGRVSTSSQKYQDNLFEANAVPPAYLKALAEFNRSHNGQVENYIYHRFKQRQQDVIDAYYYLAQSQTASFSLSQFLNFFELKPGLKRSVGKAFEIVVYALFSVLVDELEAQVSLTLANPNQEILSDFDKFIEYVLGLKANNTSITISAAMYRGGVTNAADRGIDIMTNFGPTVQVKHLRLDEGLAEEIADGVAVNDIVIVCKTAEAKMIRSLLNQIGLGIRGIVTQSDLEDWYMLCQTKYERQIGDMLLKNLRAEFIQEFPMLNQLNDFMTERNYFPQYLLPPFVL